MEHSEFLQRIQTTIETNQLFTHDDKILVGVSGGVDSIVLIQSLFELKYNVAIAHCNFKLRSDEADGDQMFVENYARVRNIPIHVCSFDTLAIAKERKESIEMTARNLRYDWFATVCKLDSYTKVAIAHNQNDSVETFFINLLRSAGLKGLTGIPMKNGNVVRPLLDVSRAEIEHFAKERELTYRVDSTNLTNDYTRNKIRNIILPELLKIAPFCMNSISDSLHYLREAYSIYTEAIEAKKMLCCEKTENGIVVDERRLLQEKDASTLLYEILYPFGFNSDVIQQIFKTFGSQSGKRFESETSVVTHDRNKLFVEAKCSENVVEQQIDDSTAEVECVQKILSFRMLNRTDFTLKKDASVASLDFAKLTFPLTLRGWKNGDSFVPFGMKGRKKVSDFLIDAKIPLSQKQHILVLESDGEIAWVVGLRISQKFAIDDKTEVVYQCEMRKA